ncbi:hypothetical protein AKJ09_04063 [Labilithrix luteola]|uniref:VWFA domain-containing protein n=1 Tax=Labilithrix luteola TaxID=1391654 RepID=A0A0K1PW81_9BACT|nr:vWA domain-containing protein [Labilithrix luteola]AKU97399.1 hypothetical protein AKJ09_04063 [Labilithrix luteola]
MAGTEWLRRALFLAPLLSVALACSSSDRSFDNGETQTLGDASTPKPDATIQACTGTSLGASHRPLDLFILLDRSLSMDGAPWDAARGALEDFFANPQVSDVQAALNYFPNDGDTNVSTCVLDFYRQFAVGLGPLPAHAPELAASLDRTNGKGNGTPTAAALRGALETAVDYKRTHADRTVALVLVSDGVPTTCTPDPSVLAAMAQSANTEYGTLTFAIGIGIEPVGLMNNIAKAGGTGQALNVNNPSELTVQLRRAQANAVGCEFVIPKTAPGGGVVDPSLVNVVVTDGDVPRNLPKTGERATCANREGWYYDNPTTPTTVRLCPASCDLLVAGKEPKIDVTFGCQTEGPR